MARKARRQRRNAPVEPKAARRNTFDRLGISTVNYKDTDTLRIFLSDRGKIRSRRVTGLTVRQQRTVVAAIKNAREMALLPYSWR